MCKTKIGEIIAVSIADEVLQCHPDSMSVCFRNLLKRLCVTNAEQWTLEDNVRIQGLSDTEIARLKRKIDSCNTQRVCLIEEMDSYFLNSEITRVRRNMIQPYRNSETLGQLLDRISILKLKEYHITRLIEDKNCEHYLAQSRDLEEAISVLREQLETLIGIFQEFRRRLKAGTAIMGPPPQIKLYGNRLSKPVSAGDKG